MLGNTKYFQKHSVVFPNLGVGVFWFVFFPMFEIEVKKLLICGIKKPTDNEPCFRKGYLEQSFKLSERFHLFREESLPLLKIYIGEANSLV